MIQDLLEMSNVRACQVCTLKTSTMHDAPNAPHITPPNTSSSSHYLHPPPTCCSPTSHFHLPETHLSLKGLPKIGVLDHISMGDIARARRRVRCGSGVVGWWWGSIGWRSGVVVQGVRVEQGEACPLYAPPPIHSRSSRSSKRQVVVTSGNSQTTPTGRSPGTGGRGAGLQGGHPCHQTDGWYSSKQIKPPEGIESKNPRTGWHYYRQR